MMSTPAASLAPLPSAAWHAAADTSDERRRRICAGIGRLAIASLYDELVLFPKPGLVSLVDSGSHDDMNAETFFRSLFSLRHYFIRIAEAGMRGERFDVLKRLGMRAEERMLQATAGINTHRGAIFTLGLLCAAAGDCHARGVATTPPALRSALVLRWGCELAAHSSLAGSHGAEVARKHAVGGARDEAVRGMPSIFEVALPALESTMARARCWDSARIDALFSLMAAMSDTNVYYRGGAAGADFVRDAARRFLSRGGTSARGWQAEAVECHRQFVERRLSPGGAADLLAAACFVYKAARRSEAGVQTGYSAAT